jgi:predicted dehydrogenase
MADEAMSQKRAMKQSITRRRFLQSSAALGAGVWIATRDGSLRAETSPNEQLAVGIIGVAHRGRQNLDELLKLSGCRVVAMCDVYEKNLVDAAEVCPDAQHSTDFRKMIEAEKGLDAVLTATADHTHAPATLMAIAHGKHVYCEKPLSHNVFEARRVREAAAKAKRVSQLGTQIHAGENYRRVVEIVRSGAIGKVSEAHCYVGKDWGAVMNKSEAKTPPIPAGLDYDTWLGPADPWPYSPEWLPANWRRWWNFGNGTLGDMGCHYMDLPFWALDLKHPTRISAEGPEVSKEGCPNWLIAHYEFPPSTSSGQAIKLHWYDGGKKPAHLKDWGVSEKRWNSGMVFVGDKGVLVSGYDRYELLPKDKFKDFEPPKPTIAKSIGHHAEWVEACRKNDPSLTTCNFDYSGLLTETVLLGAVAFRTGKTIEWDAKNLRATNAPEADQYIRRTYRKGWEI